MKLGSLYAQPIYRGKVQENPPPYRKKKKKNSVLSLMAVRNPVCIKLKNVRIKLFSEKFTFSPILNVII